MASGVERQNSLCINVTCFDVLATYVARGAQRLVIQQVSPRFQSYRHYWHAGVDTSAHSA